MKRSDVIGNRFELELGETKLYRPPPPPYIIVLASSVTTMEIKAIEFHRIERIFQVGLWYNRERFNILRVDPFSNISHYHI